MTEKSILTKNQIPLYSLTDPTKHSFFLSLYLRCGSMHESADSSGLTHLFEHISIRNINAVMGNELYSTLDKYGIELGASTYSEMVQFYVCASPENFHVASEILAKIFCPIQLSAQELEAEKKRVKAEIREADEKSSLAGFTAGCVFGDTPLSRPITGTLGSVSKITKRRLEEFRQQSFIPDNLFFFATGNLSDGDLSDFADSLSRYPLGSGQGNKNVAIIPPTFFNRSGEVFRKNADFCKVRFTFDLDMSKISVPEADLVYDILLSGYSSDLFIEMSEKRGMFYDVGGSLERYLNVGTLTFSYEVQPKRLLESLEVAVGLLLDYKRKLLPPDRCMKAGYVTNCYMLLDDPRELNFTMAYDSHILGLGYTSLDQRRGAYADVTPERLQELANIIFKSENLTLTMKCPKSDFDGAGIIEITSRL